MQIVPEELIEAMSSGQNPANADDGDLPASGCLTRRFVRWRS